MYDVHNYFLSQIQNSNKMQNFFFATKIFKLITFANFNVCSNFFVHVFSIISINNSTKRFFFRFRCLLSLCMCLMISFRFFQSSTIFNKNTFLMFQRKNLRFCILKLKFFFFYFRNFEIIISDDFLKFHKYWTIILNFSK